MFEGMSCYFDGEAWDRNLRQRWQEEFGEREPGLRMGPLYAEFEVKANGAWLPAVFTLAEITDVEALIAKVKSLLQEFAQ